MRETPTFTRALLSLAHQNAKRSEDDTALDVCCLNRFLAPRASGAKNRSALTEPEGSSHDSLSHKAVKTERADDVTKLLSEDSRFGLESVYSRPKREIQGIRGASGRQLWSSISAR